MLKFLLVVLFIPFLMLPSFAGNAQVLPTEKGTLNVSFSTTPSEPKPSESLTLNIDFVNPFSNNIQQHIDYKVTVSKDGENIFGPIPLTHTSTGSVKIPVKINNNGNYVALIQVEGILFQPIPPEKVSFNFVVGESQTSEQIYIPDWVRNNAGWWSEGKIGDSDFVLGIQFLITHGIMKIPQTQSGEPSAQEIPAWIKNNASWWANGQITDNDFVQGIQWLITSGIMKV